MKSYRFLCRTISYKKTPQATETFNEFISPNKGIAALLSTRFKIDFDTPFPSEPKTTASGFFKSKV